MSAVAKARIHLIAGARPNFMKIAPLWHALARVPDRFDVAIVHTGQHYDDEMSDVFLRQFKLPKPSYALGAGARCRLAVRNFVEVGRSLAGEGGPPRAGQNR